MRGHATLRDRPHLPVVAEAIELAVAADADAAAGSHDIVCCFRHLGEIILLVHEPAAGVTGVAELAADAAARLAG